MGKIVNRILFVVLIIAIPVAALLASSNLTLRMPDVYKYELSKEQGISKNNIDTTAEDLSEYISNFMLHKSDDFKFVETDNEREQSIFTDAEAVFMLEYRDLMDILLIVLGVLIAVIIFSYWFLLRQKLKEGLRLGYKISLAVYAGISILGAVAFINESIRSKFMNMIFTYRPAEDDMLLVLLGKNFAQDACIAVFGIATIAILVLMSATWRLTKPMRIFY